MPSFREILARHEPVLLLDAASAQVQVGWLGANPHTPPRWTESNAEAGVALFQCIESLNVNVDDVRAFVFCSGPGSVLGVRTSAMAVRAWNALNPRPTFSYHGLAVVAHALGRPEATIVADARRESWHSFSLARGLARVPTAELPPHLVMPAGFRTWSATPANIEEVPYSLATLLPRVMDVPTLLEPAESPDAFLHETPSYVTWTPQIHRAPNRTREP